MEIDEISLLKQDLGKVYPVVDVWGKRFSGFLTEDFGVKHVGHLVHWQNIHGLREANFLYGSGMHCYGILLFAIQHAMGNRNTLTEKFISTVLKDSGGYQKPICTPTKGFGRKTGYCT